MNKYLIFRTDRIGDFLITLILVKSIKRNDPKSIIKIVASKKNFNYIKSFNEIDNVFLLENNFFNKIKLIKLLRKDSYHAIIVHDSKKRSKFISFFQIAFECSYATNCEGKSSIYKSNLAK